MRDNERSFFHLRKALEAMGYETKGKEERLARLWEIQSELIVEMAGLSPKTETFTPTQEKGRDRRNKNARSEKRRSQSRKR